MVRQKQHIVKLSAVERDIDAAIQRVHEAYGTDLSAFFKKIQREAQPPRPQAESSSAQEPTRRPQRAAKKRANS
jgi:hypothetical protein